MDGAPNSASPHPTSGAPVRRRGPGRAVRAVGGLVLGTAATSVGLAIGPPFLVKDGPLLTAVAGFAALAAGLALLATGLVALGGATRARVRLLTVPLAVLGVLLAGYSITIAVMATTVPPTPLHAAAAPAELGPDCVEVTFPAAGPGGTAQLSAWYVPNRNDATVVVSHGSGSNRTSTVPAAAVLVRHGFGVLLVDARGHGRSTGRAMDFGWYGEADLRGAVDHLLARPEVDPGRIALLGLSMGGEESIGALAADPRVRAVVAEGATGRTAADKAGWLPGGAAGWLQRRLDSLTFGLADVLTPAAAPPDLRTAIGTAVRTGSGRTVLLIAAGTDPDEQAAARWIQGGSDSAVDVWVVPGARHTGGLAAAPDQWQTRVVEFLDTALGVAG